MTPRTCRTRRRISRQPDSPSRMRDTRPPAKYRIRGRTCGRRDWPFRISNTPWLPLFPACPQEPHAHVTIGSALTLPQNRRQSGSPGSQDTDLEGTMITREESGARCRTSWVPSPRRATRHAACSWRLRPHAFAGAQNSILVRRPPRGPLPAGPTQHRRTGRPVRGSLTHADDEWQLSDRGSCSSMQQ